MFELTNKAPCCSNDYYHTDYFLYCLFSVVRCTSTLAAVLSDESSEDTPSRSVSPDSPENLDDLTVEKFLRMFELVTHEAYDNLLVKRAERKKRNATKSQYFHSRIWDLQPPRVRPSATVYFFKNTFPVLIELLLTATSAILLHALTNYT